MQLHKAIDARGERARHVVKTLLCAQRCGTLDLNGVEATAVLRAVRVRDQAARVVVAIA